MDNYSGDRLLTFVRDEMSMSSYYQPLIIGALLRGGGRLSRTDLVRVLLEADRFAVESADKTLMRWPKRTLERRGIAFYDRDDRSFVLPVVVHSSDQHAQILELCDRAVNLWKRRETKRGASRFFAVIERAGGRCEACGVPGSERPLDIDHIVPQARSVRGKVRLPSGVICDVDDVENLQALCERCNRGKRDQSTLDFRPSLARLGETIDLVVQRCEKLGYSVEDLIDATTLVAGTSPGP